MFKKIFTCEKCDKTVLLRPFTMSRHKYKHSGKIPIIKGEGLIFATLKGLWVDIQMFKKYSLARNVIRPLPSRAGCTGTNTNTQEGMITLREGLFLLH